MVFQKRRKKFTKIETCDEILKSSLIVNFLRKFKNVANKTLQKILFVIMKVLCITMDTFHKIDDSCVERLICLSKHPN